MLAAWPGEGSAATRKLKLFDERLIGLAVDRLKNSLLYGDLAQRK
jgi:hypothetical protein